MSKPTATRELRTRDWDRNKPYIVRTSILIPAVMKLDGKVKRPARYKWGFKKLMGAMVRRAEYNPAEPRKDLGKCAHCPDHVYASQGQIILMAIGRNGSKAPTHKKCRKLRTEWREKSQRIYSH